MLKRSGASGATSTKAEVIEKMSKKELSSLHPFCLTHIHLLHWERTEVKISF